MKKLAELDEWCPSPLAAPLRTEEAQRLAATLKALADPARVRIVSLIADEGEVCVCNLPTPLGLSQPTISHHLKVLYEAGLVEREQRGTWAYYRLVPERLRALGEALAPPPADLLSATRPRRRR